MIKPTIGRIVWFHPANNVSDPNFAPAEICAAIVAKVVSDEYVNLAVFDADGRPHSATSVLLIQDDDTPPDTGRYCEWMPYQKGQAAKVDAADKDKSAK